MKKRVRRTSQNVTTESDDYGQARLSTEQSEKDDESIPLNEWPDSNNERQSSSDKILSDTDAVPSPNNIATSNESAEEDFLI